MRTRLVLLFGILLAQTSPAQQLNPSTADTSVYSLQLPKYWNESKVIYSVSEFIQQSVPFLRDKKLCVDCGSLPYSVIITTTPAVMASRWVRDITRPGERYDHYEYELSYRFTSMIECKGIEMTDKMKIVLVDSSELFNRTRVYELPTSQAAWTQPPAANATRGRGRGNNQNTGIITNQLPPITQIAYGPSSGFRSSMADIANRNMPFAFDPNNFARDHENEMMPPERELRATAQVRLLKLLSKKK